MKGFPRGRNITPTQWFWFLAFLGALTRFPLLRFSTAETTDGVFCLTYFSPEFVQTPRFVILPGYPFFVWLGQEAGLSGWVWGRALAALAGLLFLIPLWKLSRRWVAADTAGLVCLTAIFSPLLWQWSLKVMPDTLFLLAFTWGLERLVTAYLERREKAWLFGCFFGALASCTRPEGFLLFPWILKLSESSLDRSRWKRRGWIFIFWGGAVFFFTSKFFTVFSAYQEGLGLGGSWMAWGGPVRNFSAHLYAYLFQPFFVMTPLVYGFALVGIFRMTVEKGELGRVFRGMILPVYAFLLVSRLIPVSYIDRHMLPFLPLVLVAAGIQLDSALKSLEGVPGRSSAPTLKWGLMALFLLVPFLFSAAVLMGQKDSLGDIKRSAEYLGTLPADAVIYSDEIPKTQYWARRKVSPMVSGLRLRPGDYLVCHSLYTPFLGSLDSELRRSFQARIVDEEQSMVIPLLTDFMEDQSLQNRVLASCYRFQPQFFKSRIYEIEK